MYIHIYTYIHIIYIYINETEHYTHTHNGSQSHTPEQTLYSLGILSAFASVNFSGIIDYLAQETS